MRFFVLVEKHALLILGTAEARLTKDGYHFKDARWPCFSVRLSPNSLRPPIKHTHMHTIIKVTYFRLARVHKSHTLKLKNQVLLPSHISLTLVLLALLFQSKSLLSHFSPTLILLALLPQSKFLPSPFFLRYQHKIGPT